MPRSVTSAPSRASSAAQQLAVGVVERRPPAAARPARRSRRRSRTSRRARAAAPAASCRPSAAAMREVLRLQPAARRQRDRARARHPRRRAGGWRRASGPAARSRPSPSSAHVLLHEHGVGAVRHRRAGEDADRLARADRAAPPRGRRSGDRRSRASSRLRAEIARGAPRSRRPPNCRTAAGRSARRRRAASTRPRASCSATVSVSATGVTRSRDQPLDVVDRQQRPAEREAVVGELGHQRAPHRAPPRRRAARPCATRMSDDRLDVVERRRPAPSLRKRLVARDRDDVRDRPDAAAACRSRRAEDFELRDAPRA